MKRSILILVIWQISLACTLLHAEKLRFVTINVWSGLDYRGVFKMGEYEDAATRAARTECLRTQLKLLDADVVGCTEANKLPGYARRLAGGLHDDYLYHVGLGGLRIASVGLPVNLREGDVILAKKEWHLKNVGRRRLSGGPAGNFFSFHFADATQIIAGRITVAGHSVYVFNTHWQSEPKDPKVSLVEARRTINFVTKVAREQPVVLLGDLNAKPDAEAVGLLRKAGFIDAYAKVNSNPSPTWDGLLNTNIKLQYSSKPGQENASRERKRIDFIFVRGDELKVIRAGLVLDQLVNGKHVSDHFGVMAEIEFSPVPSK